MVRRKSVRTRGKFQLSKYFQNLNIGETVAVLRERALSINFPERLQGRTGKVEEKRGRSYIVKIKDQKMEKSFLIEPIHLKKIKNIPKSK